ncbi:MAG: NAD(P)/FAD-dependent oxidoreductase [Aeromonadaceae bacterium]
MQDQQEWDVIVIGAGAAGLMCAAQAGYRGRRVLLLDNAKKPGRKILISGGGRCNFTNLYAGPQNYLCRNPHFTKSALARYTQRDFIELVERHGVEYEEREHGQLFCTDSAKEIVRVLLTECEWAGVTMQMQCEIGQLSRQAAGGFSLVTNKGTLSCASLVVATGGLSLPKLGATPYGYRLAEQFGLNMVPTHAGLVPFTLHTADKEAFAELSGISLPAEVTAEDGTRFREALLFTHRGLSGPVILQISSYWQPGQRIGINLLPGQDIPRLLQQWQSDHPAQELKTVLGRELPKRLVEKLIERNELLNKPLRQYTPKELNEVAALLGGWSLLPNGTEGYRTAEVTLGGVDTDELSSKTMEAKKVPGLYFIGEVMDVSGHLGGFNFQWCWSSGWVAGQFA